MATEGQTITCPSCGTPQEVPGYWISATVVCAHCLAQIAIPGSAETQAPAPPAPGAAPRSKRQTKARPVPPVAPAASHLPLPAVNALPPWLQAAQAESDAADAGAAAGERAPTPAPAVVEAIGAGAPLPAKPRGRPVKSRARSSAPMTAEKDMSAGAIRENTDASGLQGPATLAVTPPSGSTQPARPPTDSVLPAAAAPSAPAPAEIAPAPLPTAGLTTEYVPLPTPAAYTTPTGSVGQPGAGAAHVDNALLSSGAMGGTDNSWQAGPAATGISPDASPPLVEAPVVASPPVWVPADGAEDDDPDRWRPLRIPLRVGLRGRLHGEAYEVRGRVRYRGTEETWDEWLLVSGQGADLWLSDTRRFSLILWYPFPPQRPIDPHLVEPGAVLNLGQTLVRVRALGTARVEYLEGECADSATVGDAITYADGVAGKELYNIQWSAGDVEIYHGRRLLREAAEQGFGLVDARVLAPEPAPAPPPLPAGSSNLTLIVAGAALGLIIVFILYLLVVR